MKNIDIKKAISSAMKAKREYTPEIQVTLFHGDGTSEGSENIYLSVEIEELDLSLNFGSELTEKDLEILVKEQNKMKKYLELHFENITVNEVTV